MSNALTLHDMSPGLRKVVGRESPRATLAEEPDAGNPLVRILARGRVGQPLGLLYKPLCTRDPFSASTLHEEVMNYTGDPSWTDGLRLVMWLSGEPVSYQQVEPGRWEPVPR